MRLLPNRTFRSVDEVREYVEKLQLLMKYIGVSDCKMQEGSLRCDVNISVRPKGSLALGTRTEIKNMNSFAFMEKALEYEFERQVDLLESGEPVVQETLRYNDMTGETESMRSKEDAHDYRYFKEPDLVTICTSPEKSSSCVPFCRSCRIAKKPVIFQWESMKRCCGADPVP